MCGFVPIPSCCAGPRTVLTLRLQYSRDTATGGLTYNAPWKVLRKILFSKYAKGSKEPVIKSLLCGYSPKMEAIFVGKDSHLAPQLLHVRYVQRPRATLFRLLVLGPRIFGFIRLLQW